MLMIFLLIATMTRLSRCSKQSINNTLNHNIGWNDGDLKIDQAIIENKEMPKANIRIRSANENSNLIN